MRFIITSHPREGHKTDPGAAPDEALISAYMKFNEDMHKAGVLVASEGMNPHVGSARVEAVAGKRKLVDGPFAETKELVGGFYLIDVRTREDAIAWALRCPTGLGFDDVLEIHALTGPGDLPPEMVALIEKAAPSWSEAFVKGRK